MQCILGRSGSLTQLYDVSGCVSAAKLLAEDCFEVGSLAHHAGRYGQAHDWLNIADELIREGKHNGTLTHAEVLEYLAWVEYVVSFLIRITGSYEFDSLTPDSAKPKMGKFSKITKWAKLKSKQYHSNVLAAQQLSNESSHLRVLSIELKVWESKELRFSYVLFPEASFGDRIVF